MIKYILQDAQNDAPLYLKFIIYFGFQWAVVAFPVTALMIGVVIGAFCCIPLFLYMHGKNSGQNNVR